MLTNIADQFILRNCNILSGSRTVITNIPDIVLTKVQFQFMGKNLYAGSKIPVANDQTLLGIGQKAFMNHGMESGSAVHIFIVLLQGGCSCFGFLQRWFWSLRLPRDT